MIQTAIQRIRAGVLDENPTFVQVIGLCPTLAVTTSAVNGVGMGLAATAVLMGSNVAISALRRFIPSEIRIPAFIVIIAGFVTLIQFFVAAYAPALDKSLGIFIPLIVVNCIILARGGGLRLQERGASLPLRRSGHGGWASPWGCWSWGPSGRPWGRGRSSGSP